MKKIKDDTLIMRQVPPELKRAFKVKCAQLGVSLQAQMLELIKVWINDEATK